MSTLSEHKILSPETTIIFFPNLSARRVNSGQPIIKPIKKQMSRSSISLSLTQAALKVTLQLISPLFDGTYYRILLELQAMEGSQSKDESF